VGTTASLDGLKKSKISLPLKYTASSALGCGLLTFWCLPSFAVLSERNSKYSCGILKTFLPAKDLSAYRIRPMFKHCMCVQLSTRVVLILSQTRTCYFYCIIHPRNPAKVNTRTIMSLRFSILRNLQRGKTRNCGIICGPRCHAVFRIWSANCSEFDRPGLSYSVNSYWVLKVLNSKAVTEDTLSTLFIKRKSFWAAPQLVKQNDCLKNKRLVLCVSNVAVVTNLHHWYAYNLYEKLLS
jgi:hypothetical protein